MLGPTRKKAKNTARVNKGIIIIVIIIIVSPVTVFAGVLFVHQAGANHAPEASATQVNHSVYYYYYYKGIGGERERLENQGTTRKRFKDPSLPGYCFICMDNKTLAHPQCKKP